MAHMGLPLARPALTLFTGFRQVDRKRPAVKVLLVQGGDRLFCATRHFYEPEAAQPSRFSVGD
jgi:hypothetical protein